MADILPSSTPSNSTAVSASKEGQVVSNVSVTKQSVTTSGNNHQTIPSQVIAKSESQITLSIPNAKPLVLDISQQPELAQRFAIGEKVNLAIIKDDRNVIIQLSPAPTKATGEVTIPASAQLLEKLTQQTSLPADIERVKAHLQKQGEINLGQARRLPQEQLQLQTTTNVTLKAALPGVSALPLNTTMQASLVLSKDNQLLVQLTPKQRLQQPTSLVMPLRQVETKLPLQQLPVTKVNNLSEVIEPAKLSNAIEKMQTVDMTKPLNQLWLRHQPSEQTIANLGNQLKQLANFTNEQIKAELNKPNQTQMTDSSAPKQQTIPPDAKQLPINTHQQTPQANQIKPLALKELVNQQTQATLVSKDSVSKGSEQTTKVSNEVAPTQPQNNQTTRSQTSSTQLQGNDTQVANSKFESTNKAELINKASQNVMAQSDKFVADKSMPPQPATEKQPSEKQASINSAQLTQQINETSKQSAVSKTTPSASELQPSLTTNNAKASENAPLAKDVSFAQDLKQATAQQALQSTTQRSTQPQQSDTANNQAATNSTKASSESPASQPTKEASDNTQPTKTEQPATASVPLKKLNELIGLLKVSQQSAINNQAATSTNDNKTVSQSSAMQQSLTDDIEQSLKPNSKIELGAINELKNLSQRVLQQLPTMNSLTNPLQLAQVVEQFSRFEPLSTASVSLTNLGPLASALHVMLGGRHIANGQSPSPQLLKHLGQLVKQGKQPTSHLMSALQMLGNLQSFKPLEEALTGMSANIQFYQYQNAEQQQTNQNLFYFNVPTKEQHIPQIEGEIEREHQDEKTGEKCWRLTLLLPCGQTDKVKVNALLTSQGVELDLTCNNASLLERANFYSGFLSDRLEALGFNNTNINCTEGEIPTTLVKRPNQLVELMI
ncbi:hypothetical protein MHM98_07345 [Psychrobium sp. MM17-31]|uniref:hypothetical protein n=1 Tax=Psychrobium sp. MM17-31 TaxID=2917758 RepID=UPI001EF5346D|nr:hypothetical protein [Psychrobium sp. MM17-31]MCG7531166.1 hypothetical protein [Psychrobium sp. MM17-31]